MPRPAPVRPVARAEEAKPPARAAQPAIVLSVCCLVAVLEGFDIQAIGVAAPQIIPALRLTPAAAGLAFALGMAGLVAGAVLGGWLTDRWGKRRVLAASVCLFGLFSLLTAAASGFPSLAAARFLTGLGLGGATPALVATALQICGPARRARTVTTIFAGMPVGGALSAGAGVWLMGAFGWKSLFVLGGLLPLLVVLLLIVLVPGERADQRPGADEPSGAGSSARALFADGLAPLTLLLWTAFAATLLALYVLLNWLPVLVVGKGLPPVAGSYAALSFNLGGVTGTLALGVLVDRFGPYRPISLAYLGLLVALAGFMFAGDLSGLLAASALSGFCLLGAQYPLYAVAPLYYPAAARGLGTGAATAAGRLGSIVGPALAGRLLAADLPPDGLIAVLMPVVAAGGAAAASLIALGRRRAA